MQKRIMVRTEFKGTHNWPEASQFAGDEVQFLEHEHRHTFKIKAELSVNDSDREVEFFVFQGMVDNSINTLYRTKGLVYRVGRRSCEHMCEEIIQHLRKQHNLNNKFIALEVWEDGEVGARVESEL